jgi:hypothetical protein
MASQVDLTTFSVAIYRCRDSNDGVVPVGFCGSGFVIHGGILITCRHCLEDYPTAEDEWYGAVFEKPDKSGYGAHKLENVSYDPSGVDLATARTGLMGSPLRLSAGLSGIAHDVGCIGYPGTIGRRTDGLFGQLRFDQQGRWLEGYVTQAFVYERPDHKRIRSWEIDMPAPSGLSGAPVILLRATDNHPVFIGVVYGSHTVPSDIGSADAMPSGYPFALAHFTDSLHALRGDVLGNQTLGEYMRGHGLLSNATQR